MPQRIQRSRAKGWRMPEGAIYVGRPSYWGNPFRIGDTAEVDGVVAKCSSAAEAVETYRAIVMRPEMHVFRAEIVDNLKGKDLACWCRLDQPCHADVLLQIANEPQPTKAEA